MAATGVAATLMPVGGVRIPTALRGWLSQGVLAFNPSALRLWQSIAGIRVARVARRWHTMIEEARDEPA